MRQTDEKYLARLQSRYRKANKKEKGAMLDEYVKTTGYHRKYANAVLRGKRQRAERPIRRPRRALYGDEEARALLTLWDLFDGIYSKRLRAAMDIELPRLYSNGYLQVSSECYQKLMLPKADADQSCDDRPAPDRSSTPSTHIAWLHQARHPTQRPHPNSHLGGLG
jgi:hypothetical protein